MKLCPLPGFEIRESEVLRYLGSKSETALSEDISRISRQLQEVARPAAAAARFPLRFSGDTPILEGPDIALAGKSIAAHLAGCEACVLLAATLGFEVDKALYVKGQQNAYEALILDACATDAIELVCDGAESLLVRAGLLEEGMSTTSRFSPGYGDLPLSLQRPFLDVLDARRAIGLTVNASLMLTPTKSVTALIGLYRGERRAGSGCQGGCSACNMRESCPYRKGRI